MKNNFDLKGYMQENQTGAYQQLNESMYVDIKPLGDFINEETEELDEKGDVKSIGDAGKMAHANTRTNLGRHRSSDTLDKQVAKDHDKNTIKGDKAAAYKAPHMKEEEEEDIFAGSDDANWNSYGNETSEWDTEIAGQTVNGWTAEETQAGSISWENPKYPDAIVYATPGWEGVDGIAVELHVGEELGEPMLQKVVGAGTDAWKTPEGYMALMAKVFATLEKALKSSEMDEDHGTAVDHDKLDNVSKDPSEFEDSVYEAEENPFDSIKTGMDSITQGSNMHRDIDSYPESERIMDMGGDQIKAGIESLLDDGFDYREILELVKTVIKANRNR